MKTDPLLERQSPQTVFRYFYYIILMEIKSNKKGGPMNLNRQMLKGAEAPRVC
jgi:hypothetical protein